MYPQIKFEISMSYSIGDMLIYDFNRTKVRGQVHSDPKIVRFNEQYQMHPNMKF